MATMRTTMLLTATFLLSMLGGCSGDALVVQVGRFQITKKKIDYRNEVERIYNPQEKRDLGLQLLNQDYMLAAILEENQGKISHEVLMAEHDRIVRETLRPETLKQIRELFGRDQNAYLEVFVMPTYVKRYLFYDYFLKDGKTQASSLKKVNGFIQKVAKSPESFCTFAKNEKVGCFVINASPAGFEAIYPQLEKIPGVKTPERTQSIFQSKNVEPEMTAFIQSELASLKAGSVLSKPVDAGFNWRVLKLKKRLGENKFVFDAAEISKDSFDEWLAVEKRKIKVSVAKGYTL